MTQLRFSMGGGKGLETVLSATSDFRGVYAAEALLAGIDGRPDSNAPEAASEKIAAETTEVRITLALSMIETCTLAQLNAAGLPPVAEMSPILLNTWLALLQRSGLNPQIEGAMLGLLSSGADTRRLSIAAGWYADVSPVTDVIDVFETLPFEAQLGVLDAWWLNPREPKVTHAFLLKLLSSERAGVRNAAARSLGQYRAPSTATALLKAALADDVIAPGALTSLMPMADLLSDTELKALADELPSAGLLTRPLIATILIQSGNAAGLQPLVAGWRKLLPRNELPLAVNVLAMQSLTAPGAYAASLRASALMSNSDPDIFLMQTLENKDLEMIRALLGLSDDDGFKLLTAMATDENDSGRIAAMNALAMGERDSELVGDWLKRLSGEIKDPQSRSIGDAISFSKTPEAEQFRSNLMQQGSGAANLHLVAQSVLLGRSETVTLEKLVDVLFDTPQSAQNWLSLTSLINRPLPPKAMRNIATALAFAQGQNLLSQPGLALMLADSGVDIFEVLYGDTPEPKARDIAQLYNTVVLCDAERAEPVLNNTELKEDGSNYVALAIAKAWLGLLADGQSARLRRGVTGSPTSLFGAVDRVERARLGQTGALRSLLDAFGPDSVRFQRGATAEARLMEQRWGGPQMNTEGVASAAYASSSTPPRLGAEQIRSLFTEAIPDDWRPWWSCRRALLQFDEASGKYTIEVLP